MTEEMNNDQEQDAQEVANIYEKVIITSKHARKMNSKRLADKEQLSVEEIADLDQRKVTTIALEDFEADKVKFERKKIDSDEDTYDLT
jgi:DNA-directed RNA polymerase omega subunit